MLSPLPGDGEKIPSLKLDSVGYEHFCDQSKRMDGSTTEKELSANFLPPAQLQIIGTFLMDEAERMTLPLEARVTVGPPISAESLGVVK